MKIVSFGEILYDVYPDKKHIGGAPLNFAAHLARHGETVSMVSAVGNDDFGQAALKQLDEWNISTENVSVLEDKQTGKCLVTLDEQSVPTYNLLTDVAYDYIPGDIKGDDFDVLYFGSLALRSDYNLRSLRCLLEKKTFQETFVDVNIRPPFYTKETVCFCVEHATILKISLEELEVVAECIGILDTTDYKAVAKTIKERYHNLKLILITLGPDGAYALDCVSKAEYACAGVSVAVVSTVGAGDSFSAAFLHQYLCKKEIPFCLSYAAKIAGFVVSQSAAVPAYRVNDFM